MPIRVHAVIVTRPGAASRAQLLRTFDALQQQTRPADAVTLVVCGDAATARTSDAVARIADELIEARAGISYADAVALAAARIPDGSSVWLLAHDTAPHPQALEQLIGALERSPSAAIAVPKLVESDHEREIVSLGTSMTRFGQTVELAAGEYDQGQHDGRDDALGADIRGMLIRADAWPQLQPDRALGGADEGLDLGVRAHLSGGRIALTPSARISVHPDGPAALPSGAAQRAYATRRAQLHRRLSYAPVLAVPLHWLTLLPLALWRTLGHLIGKRPASVLPEWGAAVMAMLRLPSVARSRRRIRTTRTARWSSIAALRVTRAQLRHALDDGQGSERGAVSELNFFSGGGAWAVLVALVVGVASFFSLLAWPVLGGGALLPLRETVAGLWQDAAWGLRGFGIDVVAPADPFSGLLALLGSLWPGSPSYALVLLWLLALPLAVLGGWFAATRVTDRAGLRIFGGIAWALAPTFLTALIDGRPTAVLLHLLLPWLFHAAVVAHRSWGAAGAASLFLAAVLSCAPSLAPALVLLWIIAIVIVLGHAWFVGALRLIWVLVPTVAVFLPLGIWHLSHGTLWALLADPGKVWAGPQVADDVAGRTTLATGFPTSDLGGWAQIIDPALAAWAPLLLVPIALLALLGALAPRWAAGIVLLVVALTGLATALIAVGVSVSFDGGTAVALWPGSGLSLAWVGVVGGALVTLDTAVKPVRLRAFATILAGAALVVCAVPSLTALHTGRSVLTDGPESTLPAYVRAEARGDQRVGTLVLTPQSDGSVAVSVLWGSSETLTAQSTLRNASLLPLDDEVADLAVDLLSARSFDAPAEVAALGIRFVLLDQSDGVESDAARALRISAVSTLDQRAGFVKVRETDEQALWRLDSDPAATTEPTAGEQATTRTFGAIELIVLFAALLLAIPTRASRRAAHAQSRIVGKAPDEPVVARRRRGEDVEDRDRGDASAAETPEAESLPEEESSAAAAGPSVEGESLSDAPSDPAATSEPAEEPDPTAASEHAESGAAEAASDEGVTPDPAEHGAAESGEEEQR